jgi:hypothetical protein
MLHSMHHPRLAARVLAWTCALLTQASAATAPDVARARSEGVSVEAMVLRDRVAVCIWAENDLKISAEYGVEFKVDRRDTRLWNERFPKMVTGAGSNFDLPLRVELSARGDLRQRRIEVDLGACSEATFCTPVRFKLTLPAIYAVRSPCAGGAE